MFMKLDVNGDDNVSCEELAGGLDANEAFSRFAKRRGKAVTFQEIDTNQSGLISWNEFKVFMLRTMDEVYLQHSSTSQGSIAKFMLRKCFETKPAALRTIFRAAADAEGNASVAAICAGVKDDQDAHMRFDVFLEGDDLKTMVGLSDEDIASGMGRALTATISWAEFRDGVYGPKSCVPQQIPTPHGAMWPRGSSDPRLGTQPTGVRAAGRLCWDRLDGEEEGEKRGYKGEFGLEDPDLNWEPFLQREAFTAKNAGDANTGAEYKKNDRTELDVTYWSRHQGVYLPAHDNGMKGMTEDERQNKLDSMVEEENTVKLPVLHFPPTYAAVPAAH
jgi:hypothetical protein